ncbi:hypothetical protein Tco_0516659 [Tanacetum coccineum]
MGSLTLIRVKSLFPGKTIVFSDQIPFQESSIADVKHLGASLYVEGHSDSSVGYRNDNDVIWGENTRRNGRIGDGANDAYKVFGEMSSNKFIKQDGSVREYYDEFISYHNACISWTKKMGQSEECLVSLFMSGLKPEIEKMVYFRPKTLHSAYLLANLQEATNELIEKKSNATTPMSSSSKINLSKEVEKVNSELVGYHECCKANEKSEEIECMGLIALDNICEENVEGVDMEWDDNNKCLVVMNKVWNEEGKGNDLESNESSEVDVYCEVRVDKPVWVESKDNSFMVLDEFIHNDGRSKDIEAFDNGSFGLVTLDEDGERKSIGNEVMINKMVEIKTDVDGFCKECDKGIKLSVTKCMRNTDDVVYVHKNMVEGKGVVEEESSFSYQNTEIIHGRKEKELKYMRLQEELKCRRGIEQRGKKMASNKDKIDSSKRYETSNLNKLTKVEEQYNGKQDGSKEGNNYFVGSDFMLGKNKEGSWWLYHIKDPCEALAYGAMNLGTSLLESIFIKPEICWCAACIQKGDKVKTTTPLRLDKMLAGFDVTMDEVFVEACDYISEPEPVLADLGYDVERSKHGNGNFSRLVRKKEDYDVGQSTSKEEIDDFVEALLEFTLLEACWLSGITERGNQKVYPDGKEMQELQRKETSSAKYFIQGEEIKRGMSNFDEMHFLWTFENAKSGVGICYWKFNIWKWLKKKKAGGMYCQVKNKEWKFDIWRWPKRKKKVTGCWLDQLVILLVGNSCIIRLKETLKRVVRSCWLLLWKRRLKFSKCIMFQTLELSLNLKFSIESEPSLKIWFIRMQQTLKMPFGKSMVNKFSDFLHLNWLCGTLMFLVDKKLKGDGMIRVKWDRETLYCKSAFLESTLKGSFSKEKKARTGFEPAIFRS